MKKWSAVVIITFLAIYCPQTGTAEPPNSQKNDAHKPSDIEQQNYECVPLVNSVSLENSLRENNEKIGKGANQERQYDPRSDRLYRWYLLATIIGVIGGMAGVVFLGLQTIATKKAAKAALENALAVINAERAWLVPELQDLPENAPGDTLCLCLVQNHGKTPAVILERAHVGHQIRKGESLPNVPNYEGKKIMGVDLPLPPGRVLPITALITATQMREMQRGNQILYIHGFVKYRDIFKAEVHETGYCFRYYPAVEGHVGASGFSIEGPKNYIHAT